MKFSTIIISLLLLIPLSAMSMELEVQDQPESRFCRYVDGHWLFCGRNQAWWNENHPGVWERRYEPYGIINRWNERESFSRLSEPADIQLEVYNTNR